MHLAYTTPTPSLLVSLLTSFPLPSFSQHLEHCGLLHFFDTVVTCEDAKHGKPAPDLFLEAARRLGVAPERWVPAVCMLPNRATAGGPGPGWFRAAFRASAYRSRCKAYEDADLGIQSALSAGMEARALAAPSSLFLPVGRALRSFFAAVLWRAPQVVDVRLLKGYPYPTEEEMSQEEQALLSPAGAGRA